MEYEGDSDVEVEGAAKASAIGGVAGSKGVAVDDNGPLSASASAVSLGTSSVAGSPGDGRASPLARRGFQRQ